MGAKFVALSTPTATVNLLGVGCKTDADCTGATTYGVNKTAKAAITVAADKAKVCCYYQEITKAPSGTTAEIAVATANFKLGNDYYGLTSTVGEYNKYCNFDYPAGLKGFTVAGQTDYTSYDAKTGLLILAKKNGAYQQK
tara:strand:+ start:490 stop:909 length:420 start_codon:yes stop_codon:yes gene_type:complete